MNAAYGKHTKAIQMAMQAPGGGVNAHTQFMHNAEEVAQMQKLGALPQPGAEDSANTVEEADVEKYGKAREKIETQRAALDRLVAAAGGTVDNEGNVTVPEEILSHGILAASLPDRGWEPAGRQFRTVADETARELVMTRAGPRGAVKVLDNPKIAERMKEHLIGRTPEDLARNMGAQYRMLYDEERALDATHSPMVARAWKQRLAPRPIAHTAGLARGTPVPSATVTQPPVRITRVKRKAGTQQNEESDIEE
jgi:hypothetical protein